MVSVTLSIILLFAGLLKVFSRKPHAIVGTKGWSIELTEANECVMPLHLFFFNLSIKMRN